MCLRAYSSASTKLYLTGLGILESEHWAEDALQEAYLKIWRHAHSYNASKSKPMTWMINVLPNQALDMLRKSQYRAEYENSETTAATAIEQDVSCVTKVRDGLIDLVTCMQHVREEQCRYILLVHHQGLTPTEIARREGRPVGTVNTTTSAVDKSPITLARHTALTTGATRTVRGTWQDASATPPANAVVAKPTNRS